MDTEQTKEKIENFLNKYIDEKESKKIDREIYFINYKYQRGIVWAENTIKEQLIISIFKKNPIGNFIIWDNDKINKNMEIVDGQQRIYTLKEFFRGNLKLSKNSMQEILNEKNVKNEIEIINNNDDSEEKEKIKIMENSKKKLSYNDLPKNIKYIFNNFDLNLIKIKGNKREISDYFIVLQNQEKLSPGEIINASIYTEINEEINEIFKDQKNINKFVELINFKDNRKDFLKILTSFFLISQNEISLGTQGKDILKKLNKFDKKLFDENNNDFARRVKKLSDDISEIEEKTWNFEKKTSKSSLKIFFLSIFFSKKDLFLEENLKNKIIISKKIAYLTKAFNSNKENGKKNIPFDYKENIKKISEVLQKTWNLEKLKKVMEENFDKLFENNEFKNYIDNNAFD